ncbi:hypothetical protein HKCCE3408_12195 [Rhodobacterales bacterium HKCCE3408]|nr:hypothetical protein [Rhodobacterales bacterium HKCCE3408]
MLVTIAARLSRILIPSAAALTLCAPALAQGIAPPDAATVAARMAQFNQAIPGSLMALNPYHNDQVATGPDGTQYRLISMNPYVNSWFVLEITAPNGRMTSYHIENADPENWTVGLNADAEIELEGPDDAFACAPWEGDELSDAARSDLPYAPICDWQLFLRNAVSGNRSAREAVADFLRDNVLFGDDIVNLIKGTLYEDAFMVSSDEAEEEDPGAVVALLGQAALDRRPVMRAYTGLQVSGADAGAMEAGSWYAVDEAPGIYASVMQPGQIAQSILSRPDEANWLDNVEAGADVYLVAFDMSRFEIGYEVGTDHPRVDWSPRPSGAGRSGAPGPDGFRSIDPLVRVGMISPALTDRVAATFTGGFKREHGAWRFGPMAQTNWGNHYGFLSNGVMMSRLWPGLSTLYMLDDGTVGMRVWTEEDVDLLPHLVFARQNGVPLVENGVPGEMVRSWGGGNWSGSAEANLRTVRSGVCLREVEGRQFLIYGYFSSATPSAQARTFQAYGCDHAMLLDMNSPELTYAAVYIHDDEDEQIEIQHLVTNMESVDLQSRDGTRLPRFVSYADSRDFFYLARRN